MIARFPTCFFTTLKATEEMLKHAMMIILQSNVSKKSLFIHWFHATYPKTAKVG